MMKYDKFDLTGKVALCAGGSSGLGYQFARAMASAGADVAIVARREDRLQEMEGDLIWPISEAGSRLPSTCVRKP